MEKETKSPTIEELQKSFDEYRASKDKEVEELKSQLNEEKRKVAQFSILGVTRKVETKVKDEETITFDFDY